ncbi:toxin-antitoxin system YwqK family antitoxin [Polaribacter sp. BAL334]|uniref:toxin-antitoxin system YwqK family antitoxin n=1 Tax=Polaribacter sp. BAL334 TaxID=1708178 RepID=UPI00397A486E
MSTVNFFFFISVFAVSQTKENEKKEYYENGKLEYLGKSINGVKTGEWKYYFENGQLKEIGNFENDDATGIWKSYYETGKLKSIGKYIEGNEAGEWKFYDENGKLVETIKYFDGKQSDNIPPIQKYLDKVVNIDQYTSPTKVSQKITVNTFISTLKSKDISWKEVYSNIKWDELYRYEFNEYKDFIVIEFIFYETLNLEIIDEEFGKENKKVESFICKIWPKDKTEVLEILKDWYDKRGF